MSSTKEKNYKVGTRSSELALIQTRYVIEKLMTHHQNCTFEIVKMKTIGDKILNIALPKIGEKNLFTKELDVALEHKKVDFVVHSLKDLPTTLLPNKAIGAILEREEPSDVLLLQEKHRGKTLATLPKGSVIGTSSLRRTAQLSCKYPFLQVKNVRGNLNTRYRKLIEDNVYDGIILAQAGVNRMGWSQKIDQILDRSEMLYAVGQGALAVECREDDYDVLSLLEPLVHRETTLSVLAERSFLKRLGGGCSTPVGVNSVVNKDTITLTAGVFSLDGTEVILNTLESDLFDKNLIQDHIDFYRDESGEPPRKCPFKVPRLFCGIYPGQLSYMDMEICDKLGINLAEILIENGAEDVMESARQEILAPLVETAIKSHSKSVAVQAV